MIDRADQKTRERKKGFVYIVSRKVTTSPHGSNTVPPLTLLSSNDLDSVDILQLVLTKNMCVSSAPETHACRPHSMLRVRGQQVGMQHHGSELNEVITLSGCKIMGSSLQSSWLFGCHSLSSSIMSQSMFNRIFYCVCYYLCITLCKKDKIVFFAMSPAPNTLKAWSHQHQASKYINCYWIAIVGAFTCRQSFN